MKYNIITRTIKTKNGVSQIKYHLDGSFETDDDVMEIYMVSAMKKMFCKSYSKTINTTTISTRVYIQKEEE